jgi:hypothetical protein
MLPEPVDTFACFNERLGRIESAVTQLLKTVETVMPVYPDPATLKGTKRALYEAADERTPLNAKKLCAKANVGHDSHARRLLADLVHDSLLKKNRGGGYLRGPRRRKP